VLALGKVGGFVYPDTDFLRVRRNPSRELAAKKVGAGVNGTHSHSTFLLEQELQCELNESRVVQLVASNSEAAIIR